MRPRREAAETVLGLAATITGHRGIKAGALRLARQLEPLTAVLMSINKAHKTRSGIAISCVVHRGLQPCSGKLARSLARSKCDSSDLVLVSEPKSFP